MHQLCVAKCRRPNFLSIKLHIGQYVEGLYCKRPIQCLASSEILTPPPPHRSASVYPPGGRTHSLGGEGMGGSIVRKTPDTALYSIYVL